MDLYSEGNLWNAMEFHHTNWFSNEYERKDSNKVLPGALYLVCHQSASRSLPSVTERNH